MGISRYDQFQAAQPVLSQEPLQYLQMGLEAKQQRYDKYQGFADELYNMQLDTLDADRAGANNILQGYQKSIDSIVDESGGDYSNLGPQLHKMGRNIMKDFSPGGQARAMIDQKANYEKDKALYQEMTAKGVLTADQYNAWQSHVLSQYKGVGDIDPLTKTYASIDLPTITKPYEVNELIDYFAKSIIPDKIQSGKWASEDGVIWEKTEYGREVVTPERIRDIVMSGIQSHEGFMDYYDQMKEFGAPMDDAMISAAVDRAVKTYAYDWKTSNQDIQWTPNHVMQARAAAAADNSERRPEYRDTGINTPGFSNIIDPKRVTSIDTSTPEIRGAMSSPAAAQFELMYGKRSGKLEATQRNMKDVESKGYITNYLTNGAAAKDNVDIVNFEKYWKSTGLDEHTIDGANAIIAGWNNIVKDSDILNPQRIGMQSAAMEQMNSVYLDNRAIEGSYAIPLNGKHREKMSIKDAAEELGLKYDDLFGVDDNKQRKASIIAVEGAENGLMPGAYVLSTPKGQILIQGRDENAELAYQPIATLGSLMHDPTKQRSPIISIPALNNLSLYATKELIYPRDENGREDRTATPRYDLVLRRESDGEPYEINTPQGTRLLQLKDLRKQIDTKFFSRMMPMGATDKNYTPFNSN